MTSLLAGMGLGFSAGISPGPLLSLVIMTSLARGLVPGLRVAMSPLFSDVIVIAASLLIVGTLPPWGSGLLALIGGVFVIYLGVEAIRTSRHATLAQPEAATQSASTDLQRGALVNLLSPHPWLFWLTVGTPILAAAWKQNPLDAAAFLAGFYALLVGSKVFVALAIAGGRRWLTDRSYRALLLASGLLLFLFGLLLLREAAVILLL